MAQFKNITCTLVRMCMQRYVDGCHYGHLHVVLDLPALQPRWRCKNPHWPQPFLRHRQSLRVFLGLAIPRMNVRWWFFDNDDIVSNVLYITAIVPTIKGEVHPKIKIRYVIGKNQLSRLVYVSSSSCDRNRRYTQLKYHFDPRFLAPPWRHESVTSKR